jgi:hypothetical protein
MRWFKLVAAFNILKLENWNLNECRMPGSDRVTGAHRNMFAFCMQQEKGKM